MGINSYITHRMFVAALGHEENTADNPTKQRQPETPSNKPATEMPESAHFSAVAQAEAAARRWRATSVTTLL